MTPGPRVRTVLVGIGVSLLLVLAWTGINGAIEQYPGIHTVGQQVQTAAQLALGVSSVLAILVTFWSRRWRLIVFTAFTVSVTLAGGLAPVAWGHTGFVDGLIAAAACLLVAQLIIWLLVMGTRQASSIESASSS